MSEEYSPNKTCTNDRPRDCTRCFRGDEAQCCRRCLFYDRSENYCQRNKYFTNDGSCCTLFTRDSGAAERILDDDK